MDTAIVLRPISVQDYHRMAELGILRPDERVELLNGQIIQMAAKGTAHGAAITRTRLLLEQRLGSGALLRLQDPIHLDDRSEPEPDIAIVLPNSTYYEDHHPTPQEVFWLIEIAASSLKFDCEVKALAYAQSSVAEYWVLDVNEFKLHVYRSPSASGYQSKRILAEEMEIAPLAFPNCLIIVKEMLRSIPQQFS